MPLNLYSITQIKILNYFWNKSIKKIPILILFLDEISENSFRGAARFNLGQNSNVGTISIRMFCRLIWKHNLLQIWTGSFDVVSDAIFFILTLDTWFNSDKIPMISFNFFHNQDICTYRHFFRWRLEIILHLFTFNNAMLWFGIMYSYWIRLD